MRESGVPPIDEWDWKMWLIAIIGSALSLWVAWFWLQVLAATCK